MGSERKFLLRGWWWRRARKISTLVLRILQRVSVPNENFSTDREILWPFSLMFLFLNNFSEYRVRCSSVTVLILPSFLRHRHVDPENTARNFWNGSIESLKFRSLHLVFIQPEPVFVQMYHKCIKLAFWSASLSHAPWWWFCLGYQICEANLVTFRIINNRYFNRWINWYLITRYAARYNLYLAIVWYAPTIEKDATKCVDGLLKLNSTRIIDLWSHGRGTIRVYWN